MKPAILILLSLCFIKTQPIEKCTPDKFRIYEWKRSTLRNVNPNGLELLIFCHSRTHEASSPYWRPWSSAKFSIESLGEFELYSGSNKTDVACQHESKSNIWLQTSFNVWKPTSVSLNPFTNSCIGVLSKDNYDVTLSLKVVDLKLVCQFLIAILFFMSAPLLSRNIVFYYGAGISIGVFASLLIVAFVIGRLVPKKSVFYSIFFACFSISAYLWNYLYGNMLMLFTHYHHYLLAYIASVSVISFAVCYYKGPISNPRLFKLIQWSIQLTSITLLYHSCQLPIVAIATVSSLVLLCLLPNVNIPCPNIFYKLWYRLRPPQIKLLTNDEYEQEGILETRKALEELREFCNSPECNAWKTVSRLRSPTKFADWVEGSADHLEDDDLFAMETDEDEEYEDERKYL